MSQGKLEVSLSCCARQFNNIAFSSSRDAITDPPCMNDEWQFRNALQLSKDRKVLLMRNLLNRVYEFDLISRSDFICKLQKRGKKIRNWRNFSNTFAFRFGVQRSSKFNLDLICFFCISLHIRVSQRSFHLKSYPVAFLIDISMKLSWLREVHSMARKRS